MLNSLLPLALSTTLLTGLSRPDAPPPLSTLVNLNYSNGAISAFSINGNEATLEDSYRLVKPKNGSTNGIALLDGMITTAVDASPSKPCTACFEILQLDGTLVELVPDPILKNASGAPDVTDVATDGLGELFLSDFGQQAVYYYNWGDSEFIGPTIVAQNTHDAASVAVSPNGKLLFLSGGCGFASVRLYTRHGRHFAPGNCFGIGTIALIGGSADDAGDVATPVDGVFGLVSISNPDGKGTSFSIPDQMGSVGGVTFSSDGRFLYVADHSKEVVYAFRRPGGGWVSGATPRHVATYRGFKKLNIIAVQ
jgi:hypothetical protein